MSNLNPALGPDCDINNPSDPGDDCVVFTLTDPDGGVSFTSTESWDLQRRYQTSPWESIVWITPEDTTFIYAPFEHHSGAQIRAVATYTDRRGASKYVESDGTAPLAEDPSPNVPPVFRSTDYASLPEGPAGRLLPRGLVGADRDGDTLTYGIVAGELDADSFEVDPATGQVTVIEALDYESGKRQLTFKATLHDGKSVDADNNVVDDDTVDVTMLMTVSVDDVEEEGVVTLSAADPEIGTRLDATLEDGDGTLNNSESWQWARSTDGQTGWINIAGETSGSYTPGDDDGDFYLRASVTYHDRRGGGKTASAVTDSRVPSENSRPVFPSTETGRRTVPENTRASVNIGAPVAAEDPENDSLTYSLVGPDAADFTINTSTGQIRTSGDLDFETKDTYSVTVEVHDGRDDSGVTDTGIDDMRTVTIEVENVEEPGTVTLTTDTATIQARVPVTAALEDDDGPSGVTWQWSRSPNGTSGWVNIGTATSAEYEPTLVDAGNYIRATATYTDGHGPNKTAEKVSAARVGDPPPVNSPPAFPSTENGRREAAENVSALGAIGLPVAATDLNAGDPLAYSLTGTDAASFIIDGNTGQLRVAMGVELDYEGKRSYRLTVQVTDGRDRNGDDDMEAIDDTIAVTVTVTNVNEAPKVTGDTTASFEENGSNAVASYSATDPEHDTLTWSVSGVDGDDFWISDRGQLYFSKPPSFEGLTTYQVTVTATDDDETAPLAHSLSVTVAVTDAEEEGVVTITPPRGWVDVSTQFNADLADDDGGITARFWRWGAVVQRQERLGRHRERHVEQLHGHCRRRQPVLAGKRHLRGPPGQQQDGFRRADDAYRRHHPRREHRTRVHGDPSCYAQRFQGGTAAGRNVGSPVRATDADQGDVLTYSLESGGDADSFDIDPATGQIRTKDVLDSTVEDTYSVTVEVHDGFDGTYTAPSTAPDDTIAVTITVTASGGGRGGGDSGGGGGFGPALTAPSFIDGFRTSRPLAVNARPGDAVGDPVAATHPNDDTVTYSLSGANANLFTVDEETGQIRLGQAVSLELGQTYTVNLTATDSGGTGAIIIVDIAVGEAPYHRYDLNRNGSVEKDEVLAAVGDYFADVIEKPMVLEVIALYFAG